MAFWAFLLPALVSAPVTLPAEAGADLRAGLRQPLAEGRLAGAIHWVVGAGGFLHQDAAGVADLATGTPLRDDTIVRMYSMTKPITSVAAMILFEQGRFALDDAVATYLPAFRDATVLEGEGAEARRVAPRRPLTIRDVLRHTTGYSYGEQPRVRRFYEEAGLRYVGPRDMFPPRMNLARAADALARVPALHHPGARFTYGYNTDLLGRLIEVWSGEPLDRFLARAVFGPLQMVDSGFSVPESKRARFSSCHTWQDDRLAVLDPAASSPFLDGFEFVSGGGGLVSTVRDYANFCRLLVDGGQFQGRRILREETLALMFTDQLKGVAGVFRFGLGFAIADVEVGSGAERRRVPEYSWSGYASTDFRVMPSLGLFQIFVVQHLPSSHQLAKRQFARVYDHLQGGAAAP